MCASLAVSHRAMKWSVQAVLFVRISMAIIRNIALWKPLAQRLQAVLTPIHGVLWAHMMCQRTTTAMQHVLTSQMTVHVYPSN